jgi:hypothetical protein
VKGRPLGSALPERPVAARRGPGARLLSAEFRSGLMQAFLWLGLVLLLLWGVLGLVAAPLY